MDKPPDVTFLLKRIAAGDTRAHDELVPLVYDQLKRIAAVNMRQERGSHTLQPTALVHEAYIRMAGQLAEVSDRAHFFCIAARAMRQVLVDHARRKLAGKRGAGALAVELEDGLVMSGEKPAMFVKLDDALNRLEQLDERQAMIVDMRYFGGMTHEEIALVLGVVSRTVKRDWEVARRWLKAELSGS